MSQAIYITTIIEMRPKMTARKRFCGTTSEQYSKILDIQEQKLAKNGHIQQMGKKDKLDSTKAGNATISAQFPQSAITVVTCTAMEMVEKKSQQSDQRTVLITTSIDEQSTGENDDFTLEMPSSADEMALSERITPSSSKEKALPNKLSTEKNSDKRKTSSRSESHEQLSVHQSASISSLNQRSRKKKRPVNDSLIKETAKKRKSKSEKSPFKKLIDKYGKDVLLCEMAKEVDLEQMLEAYKKNKAGEAVEQEATRVLGLDTRNGSMNAAKILCLENILSELCKLYGSDNFTKVSLKTIKGSLKSSEILEVFSVNEVKEALFQKYTTVDLVNLFIKNDPAVVNELLKSVSVDGIISQVRARNELNTSELLLQVMLENFSQVVPEESTESLEETPATASTSQIAVISALTNAVKSRKYLSSSEELLNVMLRDGPKILSEESKKNIINILKKKFSGPEFNDISHKVTRYHLAERVIEIN